MSNKFIQNIFSCRNVREGICTHKVLTVFGIKIKWRNKIKELEVKFDKQVKEAIKKQTDKIKIIQNGLQDSYNAVAFDLFNLHLKELRQNKETIFHLSAFSPAGNAGDNLLVPALQTSITNLRNINFINKNCRRRLNDDDIYLFIILKG